MLTRTTPLKSHAELVLEPAAALLPAPDRKASIAAVTMPSPLGDLVLAASAQALIGVWFTNEKYYTGLAPGWIALGPVALSRGDLPPAAIPSTQPANADAGGDLHSDIQADIHDDPLADAPQIAARHLTPHAVILRQCREQLQQWFAGTRTRFELPLAPIGTAFQRAVWQGLCDIPFSQIESYGALAARLGKPKASRAVGAAAGRNPITLIIPCHRLLGGAGHLTGYAGGLDRKQALLRHEAAHRPAVSPESAPKGTSLPLFDTQPT